MTRAVSSQKWLHDTHMGCYSSTQRIEIATAVLEEPNKELKHETPRDPGPVEKWTKTVDFAPGRHLRKLNFGAVVHEEFDIEPAVPHSQSQHQSWHFIHFLWFPITLNDAPFNWKDLLEVERGGNSYQICFEQRRCELVKRKFYTGEKEDTTKLSPQELEHDVISENFARVFRGDKSLSFSNASDVPLRIETGSKLETRIEPHTSKLLSFDSKNDRFFSIVALDEGKWKALPNFTECSLDGGSSYTLNNSHLDMLESTTPSDDLCYGSEIIFE